MINRDELQRDIDDLFENLTDEDIISWCDAKIEQNNVQSYLGEGAYLNIKSCADFIQSAVIGGFSNIKNEAIKSDAGENGYGMAA